MATFIYFPCNVKVFIKVVMLLIKQKNGIVINSINNLIYLYFQNLLAKVKAIKNTLLRFSFVLKIYISVSGKRRKEGERVKWVVSGKGKGKREALSRKQ